MNIREIENPKRNAGHRAFLLQDESRRLLINVSGDVDQSHTEDRDWQPGGVTNHDLATFLAPLVCALLAKPFGESL